MAAPPPCASNALDKITSLSTSLIGEGSQCGGPSAGDVDEEQCAWCTLGRDEGQNSLGSDDAPLESRHESGGGYRSTHVTPSSRTGASVFSIYKNYSKGDTSPSLVEPSLLPGLLSSSVSVKKPTSIQDRPHVYSWSKKDKVPFLGGMRGKHSHWLHVASSTVHCPLRLATGPLHRSSSTRVAISIILSGCISEVFKAAQHYIAPKSSPQGSGEDHTRVVTTEGDAKQESEDQHHKVEEKSSYSSASTECRCDAAQSTCFTFSICSWDVATYFSLGRAIESFLEMCWLDAENLSGKFYFATVRDSTTLDEEKCTPCCGSSSTGWNGFSDDCDHRRLAKGEEEEFLKRDAKSANDDVGKERKEGDPLNDISGIKDSQHQKRLEMSPTNARRRFIMEREKERPMKRGGYPLLHLVPLSNSLLIQDVMKMRSSEGAFSPPRCSFLLLHVTTKKTSSPFHSVEENQRAQNHLVELSSIPSPLFEYDLSQELSQALFGSKYEKSASSTLQNSVKTYSTSAMAVGRSSTGNDDSAPVNTCPSTEGAMASYVWPSIRCFRDDSRVKAIRTRLLLQYKAEKEIMKVKKKMEIVLGVRTELSLGGGDGGSAVLHGSEPSSEENSAPSPLPVPKSTNAHEDTVLPPSLLNCSSSPPLFTACSSDTISSADVYWPFVKPSPLHAFSFHNTKAQPIACEGLVGMESVGSKTVRVAVFIEDAVLGISSSIPPLHAVLNATWTNAKAAQLLKETLQLYIKRVCSVSLSPDDKRLRLIQSKYELFAFLRGQKKQPPRPCAEGGKGKEKEADEDISTKFPCLSALPWRSQPLLLQNGDCLFFGLPAGCSREHCLQELKDAENKKMVVSSSYTTSHTDSYENNSPLPTPQVPRALVNEVKRMEQYSTRAEKQQLQKDLLTKCFVM